jgi:uncharacterized membrane-anchored protein
MHQTDATTRTDAPRRLLTKVPQITLIFWVLKLLTTGTTRRRERFYWAAVLATFALGTAAGDLTAYQMHLGFWPSAILFACVFAIPAISWWRLRWNPIVAFWFAYIVTRPLGASFADGFSGPTSGGLHLGDPLVSVVELAFFIGVVAWVTISRRDVQAGHHHTATLHLAHHLAGHHDAEAHHHGLPAPARLAAELE